MARPCWKGRRHGRRKDRRWANAWSPEQIARRLPVDFPDDDTMRISHEAIYQALFVQGRGALRRELTACLRTMTRKVETCNESETVSSLMERMASGKFRSVGWAR